MATTARKTGSGTAPPPVRTAAPAEPGHLAEDEELTAGEESGRGLTRGVLLAGLTAGVALIICTYWSGITPRIPGVPGILGLAAGFVIVMLVFWAAATVVSWLLRWHHRDIASWGYARGKRAVAWGYGHGRRHGGRVLSWLSTWAAARWQARQAGPGPWLVRFSSRSGAMLPGAVPAASSVAIAVYERADLVRRLAAAAGVPDIEVSVSPLPGPDHDPGSGPAGPGPAAGPSASRRDGLPAPDPAPAAGAPAPAATSPKDGAPMPTTTDRPATSRTSGRRVPPVMRAVIAWIDDFEPENDADLHEFLLALAGGLHDVGASLNDLYEMCTSPAVRIGKGGMSATHTAADAIAEASAGVAGASRALAAYYEGVSEEVAAGVELPRDGDFITGDAAG